MSCSNGVSAASAIRVHGGVLGVVAGGEDLTPRVDRVLGPIRVCGREVDDAVELLATRRRAVVDPVGE
jgi:hypothetical protein